jgi:hypothetical protein
MTTAAPLAAKPAGFVERIGRAILFPQQASKALCDGQPGGLRDAAILFVPRLLISDVQRLTMELTEHGGGGLRGVMQLLVDAVGALLPDVLGIVLGGVLMSLALGERERQLRPGLTVDLAAQAWLGWLFVHVLVALFQTLLQRPLGPSLSAAVPWIAFIVWVLYILIGFLTVRRVLAGLPGEPAAPPPPPGGG